MNIRVFREKNTLFVKHAKVSPAQWDGGVITKEIYRIGYRLLTVP